MSTPSSTIVQRVWNYCNVLRDFPDLPDMLSELVSSEDLRATEKVLVELEKKLTEAYQ